MAPDKQVTVIERVEAPAPTAASAEPAATGTATRGIRLLRVGEAGSPTVPTAAAATTPVLRVPLVLNASDNADDLKSVKVVQGQGTIAFEGGVPVLEQRDTGTTVLTSANAKEIAQTSTLSTETKTGLPWMVIDVQQPQVGAGGAEPSPAPPTVRTARPFLLLAHAIEWLPQASHYEADFLVGLDPEEGSAPGTLEQPFTASLSVSCEQVTPARIQLSKMGPEGDQKVSVRCSPRSRVRGKPQQLTVRIASGQLTYPFELPAHPGPYSLVSSATQIAGLGLSTVRMTVFQALEDGSPLVLGSDVEVPLRSQTGELHPRLLTIPRGKSEVSGEVRVYGLGPMSVQAGLGPRISEALPIERGWPTFFLFVTVLGGAAGGYLAIIRQRRKNPAHARAGKPLARRVLEGSLVGVIAVGALLTTPGLADLMPDVARGNALDRRSHRVARAAPRRPEVDQYGAVALCHNGLEGRFIDRPYLVTRHRPTLLLLPHPHRPGGRIERATIVLASPGNRVSAKTTLAV